MNLNFDLNNSKNVDRSTNIDQSINIDQSSHKTKVGVNISPLIIVVAALVLLGGMFGIYKAANGASNQSNIVGYWVETIEVTSSQTCYYMYHFTDSGRVELLTKNSQRGFDDFDYTLRYSGNYRIEGDELIFEWDSEDSTESKFSINKNKLILDIDNEIAYKCDSNGKLL